RHAIEGNLVQGVSRTLWEEVKFDAKTVTSVDWMTYPILDITETPETIDVVAINHPELPPTGAGEPSIRPIAAAIANAIFDATGVRLRRVPFSPDRVKAALAAAESGVRRGEVTGERAGAGPARLGGSAPAPPHAASDRVQETRPAWRRESS